MSVVAKISQCDSRARLDLKLVDGLLGDIERDWDGEEATISQSVVLNDAIVVLLVQEAWSLPSVTFQELSMLVNWTGRDFVFSALLGP